MNEQKSIYFAFPFYQDNYVIGLCRDNWFWFYDCFVSGIENFKKINLSNSTILVLNHIENLALLDGITYLEPNQISEPPKMEKKEELEVFFDQTDNLFKTKTVETTRRSTLEESLSIADILTSENTTNELLRLRLLELSLGFIPSFQYKIEYTYLSFFYEYLDAIKIDDKNFTSAVRKKEFDKLFNHTIVPFAQEHHFERSTKTSKRLVRTLKNGLSVYLFFEYKNFGNGSYEIAVVYFDEAIGSYKDDNYLATLSPSFPYSSNLMIDSQNKNILNFYVDYWMRVMELYIIPFIEKNSTHNDILQTMENDARLKKIREQLDVPTSAKKPAYSFELPSSTRKEQCLSVLRSKSQ